MDGATFTITARHFFDGEKLQGPTRIDVRDGVVEAVTGHAGPADHHLVSPGFVDLQVNGWADVDFALADTSALVRVDSLLGSLGTTSYLATLVSDRLERTEENARRISDASAVTPGLAGIHLEGPFLGTMRGAHRPDRIARIDLGWLDRLPPGVRLVTLGAEQEHAADAVRALCARGVVASIGHSAPNEAQYESAVSAGAAMVTHLFNAMSGVHHRAFGVALAALTDPRVRVGLIADMQHVAARAVSLAFAAAGERVCLVSDSVGWDSHEFLTMGARISDGAPRLADGTLAGSSTALAECVRRCVMVAGVGLEPALRAATSVPAHVINRPDLGTIRTGRSCDIVAMDEDLCVRGVWRRLVSARG